MILLLSFCSFPWWLAWLLPFLLGLLAGWAIWSRYKAQVEEQAKEISSLRNRISSLENDLEDCKRARIEAKGRIAALETELSAALKAAAEASEKTGIAVGLGDGPGEGSDADSGDGDGSDLNTGQGGSDDSNLGAVASGFVAGAIVGSGDDGGDSGSGDKDIYAAIPTDNLQIVEGVGPKMESVLKENGIHSWSALASNSPEDLKAILAKYGDKYTRIIDPQTWPQQAGLARDRQWEDLIQLQKELDTGRTGGSGNTDSKLEKIMIKLGLLRRYKQDDLKAIEGIGPKIAGLLHDAGITTWRALSTTAVDRIQEILNAAGPRYKLADPKTWPKQAELAAEGKFKELQTYQDELDGGR